MIKGVKSADAVQNNQQTKGASKLKFVNNDESINKTEGTTIKGVMSEQDDAKALEYLEEASNENNKAKAKGGKLSGVVKVYIPPEETTLYAENDPYNFKAGRIDADTYKDKPVTVEYSSDESMRRVVVDDNYVKFQKLQNGKYVRDGAEITRKTVAGEVEHLYGRNGEVKSDSVTFRYSYNYNTKDDNKLEYQTYRDNNGTTILTKQFGYDEFGILNSELQNAQNGLQLEVDGEYCDKYLVRYKKGTYREVDTEYRYSANTDTWEIKRTGEDWTKMSGSPI